MDLLEEILGDDLRRGGCAVGLVLDGVDDPDLYATLQTAMDEPRAKHAAIARAMSKRMLVRSDGKPLTQSQVARHRNSACGCARE